MAKLATNSYIVKRIERKLFTCGEKADRYIRQMRSKDKELGIVAFYEMDKYSIKEVYNVSKPLSSRKQQTKVIVTHK